MAAPAKKTPTGDYYPQPYTTEGAEVDIEHLPGNKSKISFTIDREALGPVLERWGWNPAKVVIVSGDRDVVIDYPAIKERVVQNQ